MQQVPAQAQAHAQPPLEAEAGGGVDAGGASCAAAEEQQGAAAGAAPGAGRRLLGARSAGGSNPADAARQPAPASDGVTWALPPAPGGAPAAARPAPGSGDPEATWPQPRWGPAAVMESPFRNFVDDEPDSPRGAAGGAGPPGPQEPALAPSALAAARPASARPASGRPPARRSQSLGVRGGGGDGGGGGGGGFDGGGDDGAWNHFSIGEGESMLRACVSVSCSHFSGQTAPVLCLLWLCPPVQIMPHGALPERATCGRTDCEPAEPGRAVGSQASCRWCASRCRSAPRRAARRRCRCLSPATCRGCARRRARRARWVAPLAPMKGAW